MSSDDTQEQILDAVQAVIVRDGVRGASMRQVAQQADVSLGLLSYHFDGKEQLVVAAFQRATERLMDLIGKAMRGGSSEFAVLFSRGRFLNQLGQYDRALTDLDRALAQRSDQLEVRHQRAADRGFVVYDQDLRHGVPARPPTSGVRIDHRPLGPEPVPAPRPVLGPHPPFP